MRNLAMVLGILAALALAPGAVVPAGDDAIRAAARQVCEALADGNAAALRPVLPGSGKVRLSLARLGPEEGAFGPPQVEALLRDFLTRGGRVRSFRLARVEGEGRSHAIVQARLALQDRDGHPADVILHMSFQLESGRWVLRGLKEASG